MVLNIVATVLAILVLALGAAVLSYFMAREAGK